MLLFGGKGGVGKTTLAAAVALRSADRGVRTLLVSTDPAHSAGDIFGVTLGDEPGVIVSNLDVLEIDPAREADRYMEEVRRRSASVTPIGLLPEVERQMDLARLAPGAEDAALFNRVTLVLDEQGSRYDRMIFDTAPVGHTLQLLRLPEQMGAWMRTLIGRRRKLSALSRMWHAVAPDEAGPEPDAMLAHLEARQERFERTRAVLTDARRTAFVFVVIPERLVIVETERAMGTLGRYGVPVAGVVVNRVIPADADGAFVARRRERQAEYLRMIEERLGGVPNVRVPLFDRDVIGLEALRDLAGHLHLHAS